MTEATTARNKITKTERINLRADDRQDQVLRRAAAATSSTVSEFILSSAVQQAERVLADRRWFMVDEEQWSRFQQLLEAPLPSTTRFEALAARPSPFAPAAE